MVWHITSQQLLKIPLEFQLQRLPDRLHLQQCPDHLHHHLQQLKMVQQQFHLQHRQLPVERQLQVTQLLHTLQMVSLP
jgi:hypothetical protein